MNVQPGRWFQWLTAILAILIAIAAGTYLNAFRKIRTAGRSSDAPARTNLFWPAKVVLSPERWNVFEAAANSSGPLESGPASDRFRLAGTFVMFAESSGGQEALPRKAILDDLKKGEQYVVGESDTVDEFQVVRVLDDRVTLRSRGVDTVLTLSFASGEAAIGADDPAGASEAGQEVLQDESRFGGRVGFNRWVFKRDELMRYYQELLDDPERLAALFVSMKPVYDDEDLTGYYLESEGEREFFDAIGLREGDIVRKVNSMNMTSQKRAEYLIGEFVKNRLNAFVFDIEREGKPEKLIYLLR